MTASLIKGKVHSFQSLGTVDGPGVRFVVFTQGCNLRCGCCHNPDTWDIASKNEYTPEQIADKVVRFRDYFGEDGGVTFSGGEPLLQAEFVKETFSILKKQGINTCLDTSGSILNESVLNLLNVTDRVLLDIKYTDEINYLKHVGCNLKKVLDFLSVLNEKNNPTTLRQVIIPTINDNRENILRLKEIAKKHPCVDKIELLPFKKICSVKYEQMKLPFPFKDIPTPTKEKMDELNFLITEYL